MARRPNSGRREKLNAEQLAEFRRRLATLSDAEIITQYKAALNACVYRHWPPAPVVVQEFVQVWKELRKRDGLGSG
jgi:hypothetical protein